MTALITSSPRDASNAIYSHDIPAERPWSQVLKRGQTLRIVDSEGQQAVDALLYCAADPAELSCRPQESAVMRAIARPLLETSHVPSSI